MNTPPPTPPESESPPPSRRRPPGRRRRRLLAKVAIAGAGGLTAVGLSLAALLGTESGRGFLLRRVEAQILASSGWHVSIGDARLDLSDGGIEIVDVQAGADPRRPVVTVPGAEARWRWSELYRDGHVTLESVTLDSPVVDLGAPFPEPAADDASADAELPLTLRAWTVRGGELKGAPLESGWLARWSARELDAQGSLVGQTIVAEPIRGLCLLEPRADDEEDASYPALAPREPTEVTVRAALRGPLDGPWTVSDLRLDGEGLEASGDLEVGGGGEDPELRLAFTLDLRPGAWAPSLTGDGRIQGRGDLDLRAVRGELELQVSDVPAETVEPFVEAELFDALDARGTRLHLDADLALDGPDPADARGTVDLRWAEGRPAARNESLHTLARLEARTEDGGALVVDGSLLPEAEGERRFTGTIVTDDLRRVAEGRIEGGRLRLSAPSTGGLTDYLRSHRPSWAVAELPDGALDLDLGVSGPLADPTLDGEGSFRSAVGASVLGWRLSGRPVQGQGELDLDLSTLRIADLVPADGEPCLEPPFGRAPTDPVERLFCDARLGGSARVALKQNGIEAEGWTELGGVDGPLAVPLDGGAVELDGSTFDWLLNLPGEPSAVLADGVGGLLDRRGTTARLSAELPSVVLRLDPAETEEDTAGSEAEAEPWRVSDLRFELALDGRDLRLHELEGSLDGPSLAEPAALTFDADGRILADGDAQRPVIDRVETRAALVAPGFRRLALHARLRDGLLVVGAESEVQGASEGSAVAVVPTEQLRHLGVEVADLPFETVGRGPIDLSVSLPAFDSDRWLAAFDLPPGEARLQSAIEGELTFEPDRPTHAEGQWRLGDLRLTSGENHLIGSGTFDLTLADHRLSIAPADYRLNDEPVSLRAEAALDPDWTLGDPPESAARSVDAWLRAEIDASWLRGVTDVFVADGRLGVDIHLEGRRSAGAEETPSVFGVPSWIEADFELDGSETVLSMSSPYATRFDRFKARGTWRRDTLELESLLGRLNEGELEILGTVGFTPPPENAEPEAPPAMSAELDGYFDRVRYRVDYGLTLLSSGNFTYVMKPESSDLLTANILVERGSARRRIDASRELLNQLLAPPALDLAPGEIPDIELDVDVATIDGIRVKNNLANFQAGWDQLSIEGPLAAPRTHGSIDVVPDGRIYAYGQVLRIDRASLQLSGDPNLPSRLDLETTSSIQDPSIATPEDRRFLAASSDYRGLDDTSAGGIDESPDGDPVGRRLAGGLTTFYGNQLASQLSRGLGNTRIRYEPLWIFGETDPGARLVISQDLSAQVSLSVAVDVAQGRDQVYLLDLHGFRLLPSFSATLFTDEGSRYGATFQQSLSLGGDTEEDDDGDPKLRDLRVTGAESISERRLRAWAGVSEDDPMPRGSDFDLEVDLAEGLRRHGFPSARVEARLVPVDGDPDRVDAVVRVSLGPRLEVEFTGERPERARRRSIRALYEADYSREASIEDMRRLTVDAWRSLGYLQPEVEIPVEIVPDPEDPSRSLHRVEVHSAPGERTRLDDVELRGLSEKAATRLEPTLAGGLTRARLALEQESALRELRRNLAAVGLPDATVRSVAVEDRALVITIEPGAQQRVGDVAFEGVPEDRRAGVEKAVSLAPGRDATQSAIAEAGLSAQWYLRSHGYPEATVRPVTRVDEDGPEPRIHVKLLTEAGTYTTFGTVTVDGAARTQESWVRRMAGLETGAPFDDSKVAEARRRLVQTRIFERVRVQRREGREGETDLVFDLDEKPPYEVAYGLRWDGDTGLGALFDARHRNAGGRGIGLGARVLWLTEQKSLRLYGQMPRLLGTDWDFELYGEHFDTEEDDGFSSEGTVLSAQLDFPLGRHSRGRLYTRYRASFDVDRDLASAPPRRIRSPRLGLQWIRDRRNRPTDPDRGYFLSVDLTHAWDLEDSLNDYDRVYTQASLFRPLPLSQLAGRGDKPWVWAQSYRFGAADTSGVLPRSARFFAGGQYSVRGYGYAELGPQEELDDGSTRPAGGEAVWAMSQELRIPLFDQVSGVIFFDAGQVWGRLDDVDDALSKASGVGVRYDSPVGLLRLDLAVPLDRRPQDDELEIYFGFGHSF